MGNLVSKLELKIPPVPLTILFALLMWLASLTLPDFHMFGSIRRIILIVLTVVGLFFPIASVYSIRKAAWAR